MADKRKKTGGRRKGTPNRVTASVKEALRQAFDDLGGVEALVAWGRRNRTDFYKLWVKTLPQEVKTEHSGPGGGPIKHDHDHAVTVTAEDVALARAVLGDAGGDVHPDGGPEPVAPAP